MRLKNLIVAAADCNRHELHRHTVVDFRGRTAVALLLSREGNTDKASRRALRTPNSHREATRRPVDGRRGGPRSGQGDYSCYTLALVRSDLCADAMLNIPIRAAARSPSQCSDTELEDFVAFVLAGGEVSGEGLLARVRSAEALVFLTVRCCLSGVAALKRPHAAYRRGIEKKSGIELPETQFPFELGWVFVLPSARGRRFSIDLAAGAMSVAGYAGVFATSRSDNAGMHATLSRVAFTAAGQTWRSERREHELQLFLRPAIDADAKLQQVHL